jgi:16S rRNA (adenine1518-N6/adenine1519-N6)-dimethyltransferase
MNYVRAKKSLGQHFLKDENIARKIAGSLSATGYDSVLEIGPGMGILTAILLERNFPDFRVIEIDKESVAYLKSHFPDLKNIIEGDFLRLNLDEYFTSPMGIIGNFPYNISSQILFRVLTNRHKVLEVTGMFQKEVAERIHAGPGSKTYGILSVLVQAFYNIEYLFTVSENVFSPPPKVKSAVIRLTRNNTVHLDCDEILFFAVVKASFNQRRKTLRNSIRAVFELSSEDNPVLKMRPEQLSVEQFVSLTRWVAENRVQSK